MHTNKVGGAGNNLDAGTILGVLLLIGFWSVCGILILSWVLPALPWLVMIVGCMWVLGLNKGGLKKGGSNEKE